MRDAAAIRPSMIPSQGEPAPDSFQLQQWRDDIRLREREIAIKEREQESREAELHLRGQEQARSRWSSPLVLALLAAAIAAGGNAAVAWLNGRSQQQVDQNKSEADRILEVIKTNNDPDKAATNLQFLVEAGLISNPTIKDPLQKYLSSRTKGQGPALPGAPVPTHYVPTPDGGHIRCDYDPASGNYRCIKTDAAPDKK
jgi:hypothetical protein